MRSEKGISDVFYVVADVLDLVFIAVFRVLALPLEALGALFLPEGTLS